MPPSLPKLVTNTHVHTKTMHVSTHAHRKPCTCKHTLPPSDLIPCSLSQPQKKHIQQGRCFSSCGPSQCSVEWAGVKKEFKKKKKKNRSAFSSASHLLAPGLVKHQAKTQPRTDTLSLWEEAVYWGEHLGSKGFYLPPSTLNIEVYKKINAY